MRHAFRRSSRRIRSRPSRGNVDTHRSSLTQLVRLSLVVLLAIGPMAIAAEESGKSGDAEQNDGETPEWAQKLYGDPPEFKVFEVAGHRFRVPRVYAPGSREGENVFQITPHWPTLDPSWGDKPDQPTHRENFDTLQVTVRGLSDEQYVQRLEGQKLYTNEVRQLEIESPGSAEQVHGLWHIKDQSHYVSAAPVKVWAVPQQVVIRCGSVNCYVGYTPLENVGVHIRFAHTILPNWEKLIERVNRLLKGFKEE